MNDEDAEMKPLSGAVVDQLVQNHREFLRFLERRVGNKAEAEDILQEAFVRGVQRASAVRDDESATAWFYRVLRNALVDHHRRRGAEARGTEALARELDVAEPPPEVHSAVCACVRTLSETLKPEYAMALQRVELDGVSVSDFAAEAGISANNAAVRVHRAREALRKRVTTSCGTCADHGCLDCTCPKS